MEYGILFIEYYGLKGIKYFVRMLLVLIGIAIGIFYFIDNTIYCKIVKDLYNSNITILGILIGFTISVFTIFITIDNKNIRKAKLIPYNKLMYSKRISLYDSLVIGLAYLIILQGFLLIVNFIYPLFIPLETPLGKWVFSINITLTINVVLILMRSVLDFYFILSKKGK